MSLLETENAFRSGKLAKADYIESMFQHHSLLPEYQRLMAERGVKQVLVTPNEVVFQFEEDNLKFIVNVQDRRTAALEVLNFGPYESVDANCIFKYLQGAKVFLDIGANLGWYSVKAALRDPNLKIYAIEPIPSLCRLLNRNCELNDTSQIKIFDIGFGKVNGRAEFFYSPTMSVAASLRNITERPDVEKVYCQILTLDEFVRNEALTRLDFIKCDVEGAEKLVFDGGQQTLTKFRPIVFCELLRKWSAKFDYHPNEVIMMFHDLNYRVFIPTDAGIQPISEIDETTVATNFLFMPKERI